MDRSSIVRALLAEARRILPDDVDVASYEENVAHNRARSSPTMPLPTPARRVGRLLGSGPCSNVPPRRCRSTLTLSVLTVAWIRRNRRIEPSGREVAMVRGIS